MEAWVSPRAGPVHPPGPLLRGRRGTRPASRDATLPPSGSRAGQECSGGSPRGRGRASGRPGGGGDGWEGARPRRGAVGGAQGSFSLASNE